jgi:hypothetical protein
MGANPSKKSKQIAPLYQSSLDTSPALEPKKPAKEKKTSKLPIVPQIVPNYAFPHDISAALSEYKYEKSNESLITRNQLCKRIFSPDNPFLFLMAIPDYKKRARMFALVRDLSDSDVPFNIAKATKVDSLHGYKSREDYGKGVVDAEGRFYFPRYLGHRRDYLNFKFDDEGYLDIAVNDGPLIVFVTCKGTQMDSGSAVNLHAKLVPFGVPEEEILPFLVILYQWIHYHARIYSNPYSLLNFLSIVPERLPNSMFAGSSYLDKGDKGLANPKWFCARDDETFLKALCTEHTNFKCKILVFYLGFKGRELPQDVVSLICLLTLGEFR